MTNINEQPNPAEFKFNPAEFQNDLNTFYLKYRNFFKTNTRKATFIAMIAYALENGMTELLNNFQPIQFIKKIAEATKLEVPTVFQSLEGHQDWNDEWNREVVAFDLQVQQKLGKDYQISVSQHRLLTRN